MKLFSFFQYFFPLKLLPAKSKSPTTTLGEHYDLQSIYEKLNARYFNDQLDLNITWFGSPHRKVKAQRILGLFDFQSRLIKIHRLLDHPRFPPYFISYIVYHEMLHSVLPPLRKIRGRRAVHHGKFKEREKVFADYERARDFEKQNHKLFFSARDNWDYHGRT
ncbi:MAG TPA: hypothetical protein VGJ00_09575 [Rhabdochlamydiaceae bacterium]|jgi:hypothetical protein